MRTYFRVRGSRADEVAGEIVREQPLTLSVNGEKFLTLLCSPVKLEALVVGYLWMEKVIASLDEVTRVEVSPVDGHANVTLSHPVTLPTERILTSGCGGGITFRIDHRLFPRLASSLRVAPETLSTQMKDLFAAAVHYRESRGIHGAALSDGERLLVVAEDVGRHNAVDKVKGEALLRGIPTEDLILLSTGRISSEMLLKAARMGVPVVASRTSPTEMAIALAEQLNITVCGYVRQGSLHLLQWADFIPEGDLELRRQLAEYSRQTRTEVTLETINLNDLQPRITAAIQSGTGADIIVMAWNWPHLYQPALADVSDLCEWK